MYKDTLDMLGSINMIVWIIAPLAAIIADRFIKTPKTNGWRIASVGSLIIIGRQIIKLLPGYDKASVGWEAFHMARYLVGGVGAMILLIGFTVLLTDYLKLKAQMEV